MFSNNMDQNRIVSVQVCKGKEVKVQNSMLKKIFISEIFLRRRNNIQEKAWALGKKERMVV